MSSMADSQAGWQQASSATSSEDPKRESPRPALTGLSIFHSSLQAHVLRHVRSQLPDLLVFIGRHHFPCHKLLLVATSEYFRSALSGSWAETQPRSNHEQDLASTILNLHPDDVSPEAFRLLIAMLYSDDVNKLDSTINADKALGLLTAGIYLQADLVERFCIQFLESAIQSASSSASLISRVWLVATFHGIASLETCTLHKAAVEPDALMAILELDRSV
jgi:hypothetical protein